jgi:ABC-type glycerol-3-phosphate transport system substrate-binding protein
MKLKKFGAVLGALSMSAALALSCVACGNLGGNENLGEIKYEGEITVWWPGSTGEMQAINEAKKDYIALHPDVKINVIGQSTADFYSAYMLACSGKSAPNIAYIDHVYVQTLAYYGYITDLTEQYEDLESAFLPSLWTPGFFEDSLYALPMSANTLATVYNKTLIARAQNTTTDQIRLPKNYEEFKVLAEQIQALNDDSNKNDPYYALTIPAGTAHDSMATMSYLSYVNRCGGTGILSEDLKSSLLTSEACIEAAQKISELGRYSPATFSEAKFENGKIGFIEMGPWKIRDYERYSAQYGWEVGYTTALPFTEGGNIDATIGLYSLVVTKNANTANNQAALAADFAKFITTNDKYQLAFSKANNLLPTTETALEDEFYAGDVWKVYVEQVKHAAVRPGSPVWTDIEETLGDFVSRLVQQKVSDVRQSCVAIHGSISDAIAEVYDG